jgi:hypothetical protein
MGQVRKFRVLLDGVEIDPAFQCMGHYDVANELFPSEEGWARVAKVDRTDGKYEFVLLQHRYSRLVIEPLGE